VKREFTVVVERGEDGYLIGSVPGLHGAHSQGATLDELMENMREVIELCLEDAEEQDDLPTEVIGIHRIAV
jgi:predicted RNase H-like HicB family nuclease